MSCEKPRCLWQERLTLDARGLVPEKRCSKPLSIRTLYRRYFSFKSKCWQSSLNAVALPRHARCIDDTAPNDVKLSRVLIRGWYIYLKFPRCNDLTAKNHSTGNTLKLSRHAGVAQLVEQRTRNAQVSGPSPDTGSRNTKGSGVSSWTPFYALRSIYAFETEFFILASCDHES